MAKKALVVGCNYATTPSISLNGCINDATAMRNALLPRGFTIELMTDDTSTKPTGVNILAGFRRLLSNARSGDVLVFYYSGHGSYVKDTDGDELNGYDETIVGVDPVLVTDDVIRQLLVSQVPAGVKLYCIFDSCYSGSVCDLRYNWLCRSTALKSSASNTRIAYNRNSWSNTYTTANNSKYNAQGSVYSISACYENTVANESYVQGQGVRGAFTRALLEALALNSFSCAHRRLTSDTNNIVKRYGFPQNCVFASSLGGGLDATLSL